MMLDIDEFLRLHGSRGVTGVTANPAIYRENSVTPVPPSELEGAPPVQGVLLSDSVALNEVAVVRLWDAPELPRRWCAVATSSYTIGDLVFGCADTSASCGIAPLATYSFAETQLMAALAVHGCAQQIEFAEWTKAKAADASAMVPAEQWAHDAATVTSWALGDLLRHFDLQLHSVCVESEQAASVRRSGAAGSECSLSEVWACRDRQ